MTLKINETKTAQRTSPVKPMLVGAGIGLALIGAFLLAAAADGGTNPEWPAYWFIKPLIVVPLAGATGGAFYHITAPLRRQGGWKKAAALTLSLVVYVFGLWIGSVLGLNGTMWN